MKSKYKNITVKKNVRTNTKLKPYFYHARVTRNKLIIIDVTLSNEVEAAKAMDYALIKKGFEPINGFYTKK